MLAVGYGVSLYYPLGAGWIITSPFGPRDFDGVHTGTDFGFPTGCAGAPVYSPAAGRVLYCGAADGYGGPDPAGWIVIQADDGKVWELGHLRRLPHITVGATVSAGQQIAIVNPNPNTNGRVDPHCHLSLMLSGYQPDAKVDPMPYLRGALTPGGTMPTPQRPDFNEYVLKDPSGNELWSPNNQPRNGTKVDLFILHTQEGAGNADSLARYLINPANQVSYHYTVSQAPDGGVTVCDVVDTDLGSWSVLSANSRSINLCFAGSSAAWSRAQWMAQSRAIDVAAYLAVQDCKKYGIPLTVISPPYSQGRAGITDHQYVTRVLGDGTHTDVGPNFPWDYFSQRVQVWAGGGPEPIPATPTPAPSKTYPRDFTDRELLEDIWQKLMKLVSK